MIRTIVALLCMTVMSSFCFAHGNEQHVMGTVIKVSDESVTKTRGTRTVQPKPVPSCSQSFLTGHCRATAAL